MYGVVVEYGYATSFHYAKDKKELISKLRNIVMHDFEKAYSIKVYNLSLDEALAEFCELAEYSKKECKQVMT